MAATADVTITLEHGDTCTCRRLNPVHTTVAPVVADPECPGAQDAPPPTSPAYAGHVIITWPQRRPDDTIPAWGIAVHDADTGQLIPVSALHMHLGGTYSLHEPIWVDLVLCVDAEDKPLTGEKFTPILDDDGKLRIRLFRYLVAEMRTTNAPQAPTFSFPATWTPDQIAAFELLYAEAMHQTRSKPRRIEYPFGSLPSDAEALTITIGDPRPSESRHTMTWSLNASGHTPTPDGAEDWAEVEQEFHAKLQKVLSNPKYGATFSHFSGNHVQGPMHLPAEPATEDTEPAETTGGHDHTHAGEDAPTHHQHRH